LISDANVTTVIVRSHCWIELFRFPVQIAVQVSRLLMH